MKKKNWLPKVKSWKGLIGSCALWWEDAPPVLEALCWDGEGLCCDGEVLHCDDEKKTFSGAFKEPMEWERDWTENIINVVGCKG